MEHLTLGQLAAGASQPHACRVKYAYHLSTDCCDQCWSAIAAIEPAEPRQVRDPFLCALARVLEEALKTYEILNLELDFLETWKVLDRIDTRSRSRISDRAYKAFGKKVAHRMVREVSGTPDPMEKGEVLV